MGVVSLFILTGMDFQELNFCIMGKTLVYGEELNKKICKPLNFKDKHASLKVRVWETTSIIIWDQILARWFQ